MLVMNTGPWEGLIVHEVGHIYFYGILANNELAEAWLDEGFTSYQENWYEQHYYGDRGYEDENPPDPKSWKFKLNPKLTSRERTVSYLVDYLTSGYNEPLAQYAQDFNGGYGINAYTKGAAFFEMLHKMVGDSLWDEICHTYFDRWKFKHVNEQRFKQVCEEVTGMNLDWYFDQWLHRTVNVDYARGKVSKSKQADGSWKTSVAIHRKDQGIMPVEVEVTTVSGQSYLQKWDGRAKMGKLIFETDDKPERVVVDPNDIILDRNRLNNGNISVQFLPDNPLVSGYKPRDFYVIKYAPKIWYNDVDGVWGGARLRGSYLEKFLRTEAGLTWGLRTNRIGGNLKFGHPV
ncbi:MAG: M1 family aminopeptidase, partial [bacterium]|nr:M1 family aminopeptidase [bacterium]